MVKDICLAQADTAQPVSSASIFIYNQRCQAFILPGVRHVAEYLLELVSDRFYVEMQLGERARFSAELVA
jgi:hypothetical protein